MMQSHFGRKLKVLVTTIFSFCLLIAVFDIYNITGVRSALSQATAALKPIKTSIFSTIYLEKDPVPNCTSTIPENYKVKPLVDDDSEFLKPYVEWHAKKRKCLADPSCKEKPKILVARCPLRGGCLGLGDRMRGIYFSFWLAIATERVFFIEWPKDPYWLQIGMIPASLDWTIPTTIPLNDSWPYLDWNKDCTTFQECKQGFPNETKTFSYDGTEINFLTDNLEEKLGDTQLLSMYSRYRPDRVNWLARNPLYAEKFGKYVSTRDSNEISRRVMLRSLFYPSPQTISKMSAVAFKEDEKYYAMHVRTGEAARETTLDRFASFKEKGDIITKNMVKCLDLIRNGTGGPKRVFLAADSTLLKEYTTELFTENGYEVRSFQDEVVHVGKIHHLSKEFRTAEVEMCDSFLSVYADLFMLARAEHIVGSGSHFSALASALTKNVKLLHIKTLDEEEVEKLCTPMLPVTARMIVQF